MHQAPLPPSSRLEGRRRDLWIPLPPFPRAVRTHYGIKERPIPPPPPGMGWLAGICWQEKQAAGLAFKCDFFCSSSFPLPPPPPLALELKIHPRPNPMSRISCSCKKVRLLFAEFFAQTGTARPRSQQPQRREEEKREEDKEKRQEGAVQLQEMGGGRWLRLRSAACGKHTKKEKNLPSCPVGAKQVCMKWGGGEERKRKKRRQHRSTVSFFCFCSFSCWIWNLDCSFRKQSNRATQSAKGFSALPSAIKPLRRHHGIKYFFQRQEKRELRQTFCTTTGANQKASLNELGKPWIPKAKARKKGDS